MKFIRLFLGIAAGLFCMALWNVFIFYNPYASSVEFDVILNLFVMLFLPACLAIYATMMNKKILMLIAFIWSLPISFYAMLTPGIFSLFIYPCIAYFICFLMMIFPPIKGKWRYKF